MRKFMNRFIKKNLVSVLAVFLAVGLAGCGDSSGGSEAEGESTGEYKQITMDEAVTMMDEKTDYIILDVRRPDEFAEKHIPNAINVPNETIGEEAIPELPDKDQLLLVYCRSGNRSKQASKKLAAMGYTNVYEFGGINDWPGETVGE